MPKIAAIIPTLTNTIGLTRLLRDLQKQNLVSDVVMEIIIVDNAPKVTKKIPVLNNLLYLPQIKNLGFAAAINHCVKKTSADTQWLLILNDDLELPNPNTLLQLLQTAQKKHWSAISPVLTKPDNTIENLGYQVLPQGKVKLNFDPYMAFSNSRDIFNKNEIAGLTAACLLIKKSTFEQNHGFREKFFAYLEDVDLFLRLKQNVPPIAFGVDTQLKVIHQHRGTSSKMGNFKQKQDFKNWWRVIAKNWSWQNKIKYIIPILIERGRNLSGLIKGSR